MCKSVHGSLVCMGAYMQVCVCVVGMGRRWRRVKDGLALGARRESGAALRSTTVQVRSGTITTHPDPSIKPYIIICTKYT